MITDTDPATARRVTSVVVEWLHALLCLVTWPVLAGVVTAFRFGWWWGLAAFTTAAALGVHTVLRTTRQP